MGEQKAQSECANHHPMPTRTERDAQSLAAMEFTPYSAGMAELRTDFCRQSMSGYAGNAFHVKEERFTTKSGDVGDR